jgi:hypothetical protein
MHPLVVYNEWLRGFNIFLYIIIIEVINNAYLMVYFYIFFLRFIFTQNTIDLIKKMFKDTIKDVF